MGDVGAGFFSCMHHRAAFSDINFFAVEFNFNHHMTRSNVGRNHTGLVRNVVFKFWHEMLEHGAHRHRRGVT